MRNLTSRVVIFIAILVIGTAAYASTVPLVPAGTSYDAPTGGTLVLSEDYGYNADGQGSWYNLGTKNAITVNADHILVGLKDYDQKKIAVALSGLVDIATDYYTIDIGFKLWRTDYTGTQPLRMVLASSTGTTSGPKIIYSVNSDVANVSGTLWGEPSGAGVDMPQNTPQVIRFTGNPIDGVDYTPALANESDDITLPTVYWGSTSDILALTSGSSPRWAVVEISWMRIYKDVMDDSAPLVPEPATMTLLFGGGIVLAAIKRRK